LFPFNTVVVGTHIDEIDRIVVLLWLWWSARTHSMWVIVPYGRGTHDISWNFFEEMGRMFR
jgi:hypothetical protein